MFELVIDSASDPRRDGSVVGVGCVAVGYEMTEDEAQALPEMAAKILDDARTFQGESMSDDERHRSAWRSRWLRDNTDYLIEP